jgi:hypothetical protein
MIYLIGCDHLAEQTYQILAGPDLNQEHFKQVLRDAIQFHGPDLIAEEHHTDFLVSRVKSKSRRSIALDVDSELRICHRFCDPSRAERRRLYIDVPRDCFEPLSDYDWYRHEIAHRTPIREGFWIAHLRDDIRKKVIFICGAMHILTFKERFTEMNVKVEVLADFVSRDPSLTNKEEFRALEDVLKNGFAPVTKDVDPRCFCVKPRAECSAEFGDLE